MRRFSIVVLVAIMLGMLSGWPATAQVGSFTQLELSAGAPPTVGNFGGSFTGNQGGQTNIYYWIVAKYPIGDSLTFGPLQVGNTFGRHNLGGAQVVNLQWTPVAGAVGYDVVTNVVSVVPLFPCTACAVVLSTAGSTLVDDGTSNLAYGGPQAAGEARMVMNLNNRDEATPYAPVVTNGVPGRLVLAPAVLPADGCAQWSGRMLGSTGAACVSEAGITREIASGTATLGIAAIALESCAAVVTVAASGVATTDVIFWTPNADITSVTGYVPLASGGLAIYSYPTTNNVNFKVCNPTGAIVTPGAVTLNWRVDR